TVEEVPDAAGRGLPPCPDGAGRLVHLRRLIEHHVDRAADLFAVHLGEHTTVCASVGSPNDGVRPPRIRTLTRPEGAARALLRSGTSRKADAGRYLAGRTQWRRSLL